MFDSVYHTPGAFGNFVAYLVDCHEQGRLLEDPFTGSGSSHNRSGPTKSLDIVLEDNRNNFINSGTAGIGVWWPEDHFNLILHSTYGRTNEGQYGSCGVEALQEDAWDYLTKHSGHSAKGNDWIKFVYDLKFLYNFTLSPDNRHVPRMLLRQYFFFMLCRRHDNKLWTSNNDIKHSALRLISTSQVLEYDAIHSVMHDMFGSALDFHEVHRKFIDNNKSLHTHKAVQALFSSCLRGDKVRIDLDVLGEACLLFELERHYKDIPFHNVPAMFVDTGEVYTYVRHFPNMMKQPNNLFKDGGVA